MDENLYQEWLDLCWITDADNDTTMQIFVKYLEGSNNMSCITCISACVHVPVISLWGTLQCKNLWTCWVPRYLVSHAAPQSVRMRQNSADGSADAEFECRGGRRSINKNGVIQPHQQPSLHALTNWQRCRGLTGGLGISWLTWNVGGKKSSAKILRYQVWHWRTNKELWKGKCPKGKTFLALFRWWGADEAGQGWWWGAQAVPGTPAQAPGKAQEAPGRAWQVLSLQSWPVQPHFSHTGEHNGQKMTEKKGNSKQNG